MSRVYIMRTHRCISSALGSPFSWRDFRKREWGREKESATSAFVASALLRIGFPLFQWKIKALSGEALSACDLWLALQRFFQRSLSVRRENPAGQTDPEGFKQRQMSDCWWFKSRFLWFCPVWFTSSNRCRDQSHRDNTLSWLKLILLHLLWNDDLSSIISNQKKNQKNQWNSSACVSHSVAFHSSTELGSPRDLQTRDVTDTSFLATWVPAPGKVRQYRITWKSLFTEEAGEKTIPGDTTATVLDGLTPETRYQVSVFAVYGRGEGRPLVGEETTDRKWSALIHNICLIIFNWSYQSMLRNEQTFNYNKSSVQSKTFLSKTHFKKKTNKKNMLIKVYP